MVLSSSQGHVLTLKIKTAYPGHLSRHATFVKLYRNDASVVCRVFHA